MDIRTRPKEISWLSFNARVLQEAANPAVPLAERIKFLGIYSNNLDEFFRVRVANLKRLSELGSADSDYFSSDANLILQEVHRIVIRQREDFEWVYQQLLKELAQNDIFLIDEKKLLDEHKPFVVRYFGEKIRPNLVPILVDRYTDLSILKGTAVYLLVILKDVIKQKDNYALLEIPSKNHSRFLVLPKVENQKYLMLLDDVIRFNLHDIFSMFGLEAEGAYTVKFTRDAELEIDDDLSVSYVKKVSRSLRQRREGEPVRVVYDKEMPESAFQMLKGILQLSGKDAVIPGGRYHNFKDFINFPKIGKPEMYYEPLEPIKHPDISAHKSILRVIRQKDLLFHFPYQSFHYVIDLLREAAIDPKVKSIAITIYRVAHQSNVMNALINAIKNGKKVTAILELQARFDEESNIYWSRKLTESGAKVIYGVPGMKVHSKLILISRLEEGREALYAGLGTGNFNEDTAQIFSDHLLLTAHDGITQEVASVFDFFEHNYKISTFKHLWMSPFYLRSHLEEMISREIKHAEKGRKTQIYFKVNNLVDQQIINRLFDAKKAGVDVRLNVRGMFSMFSYDEASGLEIPSIGIIDRFLEHTRVFYFYNNGEEKLYLSSADLMERNLDRRVEIACPVYDRKLRGEIKAMLEIQWKDNVKARLLDNDLVNEYRTLEQEEPVRSQYAFYDYLKEKSEKGKS